MGTIIGDFKELEEAVALGKMSQDEYQEIFEKSRFHGLDNSIYPFCVGGSDAPIIMGESSFSSPLKLYNTKVGNYVPSPSKSQELVFLKGHLFEGPYRDLFTKMTGIKTTPYYKQTKHDDYPHCVANVDGLVYVDGEVGLYEGKTTSNPAIIKSFKKGVVPLMYYIQVQFYLEVLDEIDGKPLEFAYINCGWGLGDDDMRWIRIDRDRVYGKEICETCEQFVLDAENGILPTNDDVSKLKVIKSDAYANYGPVDKKANPIELDGKHKKAMVALEDLKKKENKILHKLKPKKAEDAKIKEKYKALSDDLKRVQEAEEEIMCTFVDILKDNPEAILKDGDKTYHVIFDDSGKPTFDSEVKAYFKKTYPDVWNDVMTRKPNMNRNFKFKVDEE